MLIFALLVVVTTARESLRGGSDTQSGSAIAASDCTQTNGVTSNTDACLCGGTRCTAASGLFCYASNSQCSLVAIPESSGSKKSRYCGVGTVWNDNEQLCIATHEGILEACKEERDEWALIHII